MGTRPRIGLMGGTFDPIHHGHLVAAAESRYALGLDRVVFVVAGHPWQKPSERVWPAEDRYRMTVLATEDDPGFEVSRVEIDREGPTYTIDTLRAFREREEQCELFFITGADAILQILTWKDHEEAVGLARFVAVSRPGYDLDRLASLDPGVRERVEVIEIPALAISSSDIRRRVAKGRPIRYLAPDVVASYIKEHGLYR